METRPKLKIPLSNTDKALEALGWFTIFASWLWAFLFYSKLPETIPSHFGISGAADAFGPKTGIFSLPGIATVLFIGLTILNRFPHIFNYPETITQTNALRQYTYATRLVRFLKLSVALIFLALLTMTSLTALHRASGLEYWFLPAALALVFIPMAFYIFKAKSAN